MYDLINIKPNYSAIARKYGLDRRTVKKYCEGYEGKSPTKNKFSILDEYKAEISSIFESVKNVKVKCVYEALTTRYGIDKIGSYSNFVKYVRQNELQPPDDDASGHPRFETVAGQQAQCDWVEEIKMTSTNEEEFVINVFHMVLSFSRYSVLTLSIQKTATDVYRCLLNSFDKLGGVPDEILFDNMSTVVNVSKKHKKTIRPEFERFARDCNFKVRLCKARSPETKGCVESRNKIVRWLEGYQKQFDSLNQLEEIVNIINKKLNINICQGTDLSPVALFVKEKEYLNPLPTKAVTDQYLSGTKVKVAKDALVYYEGNKYSVDKKLIGSYVTLEVHDDKLYIYYSGNLQTCHPITKNKINYKPEHYRDLMKGKVKPVNLDSVVENNLKTLDNLLNIRKISMSPQEAAKSEDNFITFLNRTSTGKNIINYYSHLIPNEQPVFRAHVTKVLPYIHPDQADGFINLISAAVKESDISDLELICVESLVTDYDTIFTEEGIRYYQQKYKTLIESLGLYLKQKMIYDDQKDPIKNFEDIEIDDNDPFKETIGGIKIE